MIDHVVDDIASYQHVSLKLLSKIGFSQIPDVHIIN